MSESRVLSREQLERLELFDLIEKSLLVHYDLLLEAEKELEQFQKRVKKLERWLRNIEALGKDTHKEEPEMNCHICLMAANATEALNPRHEEGE